MLLYNIGRRHQTILIFFLITNQSLLIQQQQSGTGDLYNKQQQQQQINNNKSLLQNIPVNKEDITILPTKKDEVLGQVTSMYIGSKRKCLPTKGSNTRK